MESLHFGASRAFIMCENGDGIGADRASSPAALVLSKKVTEIWGAGDDSTEGKTAK